MNLNGMNKNIFFNKYISELNIQFGYSRKYIIINTNIISNLEYIFVNTNLTIMYYNSNKINNFFFEDNCGNLPILVNLYNL